MKRSMRGLPGLLAFKHLLLSSILVALSASGCGQERANSRGSGTTLDARASQPISNPFPELSSNENNPHMELMLAPLRTIRVEKIDSETLWALSSRQDTYGFTQQYMRSLAPKRGALPQLLVPEVKREVKNNSFVQSMVQLSKSTLKPLVDLMFKVLVNDEVLAAEIRASIMSRLRRALPTGDLIPDALDKIPLRFDLFPGQSAVLTTPVAGTQTAHFQAIDQAVRAAYVFNAPELWGDQEPIDSSSKRDDPGLQLLQVMRVMAEWQYVFGLGGDADEAPAGGLLIDASRGIATGLTRLDPNAPIAGTYLFSGQYDVHFEDAGPLGLGLNVKEIWQRETSPIELVEQAMIAETAAKAFSRLRPSARRQTASLFDSEQGLFPDNAHELALAFLPGLQAILENSFIDQDKRLVRRTAPQTDAAASPKDDTPADLRGLVRTLRALASWHTQLTSLNPGEVSATAIGQIGDGAAVLERAMQLISYLVLRDHLQSDGAGGLFLTLESTTSSPRQNHEEAASASLYAEALAVLLETNMQIFHSDFLRERSLAAFRWYAIHVIEPIFKQAKPHTEFDAAATLWTIRVIEALAADPKTSQNLPWLDSAKDFLHKSLNRWNEELHAAAMASTEDTGLPTTPATRTGENTP